MCNGEVNSVAIASKYGVDPGYLIGAVEKAIRNFERIGLM